MRSAALELCGPGSVSLGRSSLLWSSYVCILVLWYSCVWFWCGGVLVVVAQVGALNLTKWSREEVFVVVLVSCAFGNLSRVLGIVSSW
mmetsp:Transcript_32652/g.78482  ORF Transcript_32652/g.78482 Transcript_32652/m.78482 type:complete len:88 (+) Transcript_32652:54-317(+)